MSAQPDGPTPLDVAARVMHEYSRRRIKGCPAWQDLDMCDPWHSELIRLAYERARDLIAMQEGGEHPEPLQR